MRKGSVDLKTIKNNMGMFLEHCSKNNIKPVAKRYNQFLDDNDLKGKRSTISKKGTTFQKLRERLIKENGYNFNLRMQNFDREKAIDDFFKAVEVFGENITQTQYNKYSIANGLTSFSTLYKYFGTFNQIKDKFLQGKGQNRPAAEYDQSKLTKEEYCELCRFVDNCEYNYNLEECEYYES